MNGQSYLRLTAQVTVDIHLANCMLQVSYDITCETPCQKVKCLTYHSDMMEDVSNLEGWLAVHCSSTGSPMTVASS